MTPAQTEEKIVLHQGPADGAQAGDGFVAAVADGTAAGHVSPVPACFTSPFEAR